ncbi:hypothetical protein V8E55_011099 [Tylopilus felleus]
MTKGSKDGCISLLDLILRILQLDKADFRTYQDRFFENPIGRLSKLLDYTFEDKEGHTVVLSWMKPHAIELVSDKVSMEMDVTKTVLTWTVDTQYHNLPYFGGFL